MAQAAEAEAAELEAAAEVYTMAQAELQHERREAASRRRQRIGKKSTATAAATGGGGGETGVSDLSDFDGERADADGAGAESPESSRHPPILVLCQVCDLAL